MANKRSLEWYHANKHLKTPEQRAAKNAYMREYRLRNLDKWKRTPEQQAKINARKREMYAQRPEMQEEYRRKALAWVRNNPEKKRAQALRRFGLTYEQYQEMLAAQSGKCAICGYSEMGDPKFFPVVDHCHTTGKVRGLLCMNCNMGIGKMMDSPEILQSAIHYLESSKNGSCGAS